MAFSTVILLIIIALFFFGTNVYISCRMYQCLHALFHDLNMLFFGIICVLLAALAFLSIARSHLNISPHAKYALGVYGGVWMSAYVYLLLTLIAADMLLLVLGAVRLIPLPVIDTVRFLSSLAAILVTAVIIIAGTIHADNYTNPSYEVRTEKIADGRGWNIVLVSDLHIGAVRSEKRLERLVSEINAKKPDIVCIAGDIFDNDFHAIIDTEHCAEIFRGLNAEYGVFACLGNHDAGDTLNKMLEFLPKCNITLLDEKYTLIENSLILAGRLDGSPIGSYGEIKRGDFDSVMTGADKKLPVVVLDHTPSHIDEYPDFVDLILCGHTHRGQIFPGCLFTKRLFKVDYGLFKENENSTTVIVTSGASTWGMPVRVGTDSEIVSIRLY